MMYLMFSCLVGADLRAGREVGGQWNGIVSLVWLGFWFGVWFGFVFFLFTATIFKERGRRNEEWGTMKEKGKEEKYFCADVD